MSITVTKSWGEYYEIRGTFGYLGGVTQRPNGGAWYFDHAAEAYDPSMVNAQDLREIADLLDKFNSGETP